MRIVLLTHAFAPSVGGVETVTRIIAERFQAEGSSVTVVTSSADSANAFQAPYTIIRKPSLRRLFSILRDADAVIQSNITLTLAWPLYLARIFSPVGVFRSVRHKPFVTVLHSPISIPGYPVRTQERLKNFCLRYGSRFAISSFLRQCFEPPCGLLPNPYAEEVFRAYPGVERSQPLLFVGRLTVAKGCDTAIEALSILHRTAGIETQLESLHLNIVGNGPDEAALRQQAADLGIAPYVHFLGPMQGTALAQLMNEHTLLLVPSRSRPPEALGIVVLEGIACGCVPIVSSQGGLPEAIGPCGLTFPEGEADALADRITSALSNHNLRTGLQAGASTHLARHRIDSVFAAYKAAIGQQYNPAQQR